MAEVDEYVKVGGRVIVSSSGRAKHARIRGVVFLHEFSNRFAMRV